MREGVVCDACFDGWIPGECGVVNCQECLRFGDAHEAANHVGQMLEILQAAYDEPDARSIFAGDSWVTRAVATGDFVGDE